MKTPLGIATLKARLGRDAELVARLAAPLWARVGRTIGPEDLSWTRTLAGDDGPRAAWGALEEAGGVTAPPSRLDAGGVARLCVALISPDDAVTRSDNSSDVLPRLVWTLPRAHVGHARRGTGYREAIINLIGRTRERLILLTPFVDLAGVGGILTPLLSAMLRGVEVTLLTHDALNIASYTSRAIEELRQEAERIGGNLSVYSAEAGTGRDRETRPLLHAKLVICDRQAILIGSANLTSHALASNLEAGVLLGAGAAEEAVPIVDELIATNCVYLVFRTGQQIRIDRERASFAGGTQRIIRQDPVELDE
jgi:HKD family nuclease